MTGFIPNGAPPTQGAAVPNGRPPSRFGGAGSPLNANRVKAGSAADRIKGRSGESTSQAAHQVAAMNMGVVALAGGTPSPLGQGGVMGLPMGGVQTGFPGGQPDPNAAMQGQPNPKAEFRNTMKGIGQEALQGAVERAAKGQSFSKNLKETFKDGTGKTAAATGDHALKTWVGISDVDKRAEMLGNFGDIFNGGRKPSSTNDADEADDTDEANEAKRSSAKDKTSEAGNIAAGLATSGTAAAGTSAIRKAVESASTSPVTKTVTTAAIGGAGIGAGTVAAGAAAVATAGGLFYALKQNRKRKREAQQDLPPEKKQKTSETPSEDAAESSALTEAPSRPKRAGGFRRTRRSRRPAAGRPTNLGRIDS